MKQDPDQRPFKQDEAVDQIMQKRSRKYDRAKRKGLLPYWTGYMTAQAFIDRVKRRAN